MVKAIIFYSDTFIFAKTMRQMPLTDEEREHYKPVAHVTVDLPLVTFMDYVWAKYNSPDNPLGTKENQEYIRKHKLHTSISIGDLVFFYELDELYRVADIGFEKVDFRTSHMKGIQLIKESHRNNIDMINYVNERVEKLEEDLEEEKRIDNDLDTMARAEFGVDY